jgi:hypothetical protein
LPPVAFRLKILTVRISNVMKAKYHLSLMLTLAGLSPAFADNLTTRDGQTYTDIRNVALKPKGLFFVTGSGDSARGVTVPYASLSEDVQDKYHCGPFDLGLAFARENRPINLTTNLAFSLSDLDAAKKQAKAEHKMIGFIMVWGAFFVPARPLLRGSDSGLAHFYDVFHNALVLVFVRHESELGLVPDAVKAGFSGPEEGGFAPNMAVVTADCSQFVCEIPYGGNESNGGIRDKIFRDKIAVIKQFARDHPADN